MKKLFLASVFTLLSLCANAYDFEADGICYNITGDNTVEVTENSNGEYAGDIVIPNKVMYNSKEYSVTSIGRSAFSGCRGLTAIDIPEGVTSIGYSAFFCCSGLTEINIPEGVTSIGGHAFWHSGLTEINIPASVTMIGALSFLGCGSLADIYCYASTPARTGSNTFTHIYSKCTLHVPYGTMNAYIADDNWKNFTNIVEFDPTSVEAVSSERKSAVEQRIYNLGGVRMAAPQRGLNIINGKKVIY